MPICNRFILGFLIVCLLTPDAYPRTRKSSGHEHQIDLQTISSPQDGEVCFSPDEPCDLKLLKFIQSAKVSIDLAIFDINLDQIVHELLVAKAKGIKVRVLVDARQSKGEHSLVNTLVKGDVGVRKGRQRGIMHNKFVIIDGKAVEVGSFNFTKHAAQSNNENQLYDFRPNVVKKYVERFEVIWERAKPMKER